MCQKANRITSNDSSNYTGADLEAEIIEMLERLKYASITITPMSGSNVYNWRCAAAGPRSSGR